MKTLVKPVELIDAEEIARKVENGAAKLDEIYPEWSEFVDLHQLNLMDGIKCVLGQLYGSFPGAKKHLAWTYEQCDGFGFYFLKPEDMTDEEFNERFRPYYREAQECWLGQIADRLRGDK